MPYSESHFEETKYILVEFSDFPVFKNTNKRIEFKNASELSLIFYPFLYANVPAQSPSYAPTFFVHCVGIGTVGNAHFTW